MAVAPSPLAPGPSSPGPAAPRHPAPDLILLDLQLLDHGFPAPRSPNPGPQLLPLGLEEGQDNIQVKALAGKAKSSPGHLGIEKCYNCSYNFPLLEVRTHSRITFQWNQCEKAFTQKVCLSPHMQFVLKLVSLQQMHISRFILPCKSVCQSIFLKNQRTYSLYAKV